VTTAACIAKAQDDAQMTERTRKPLVPGHNIYFICKGKVSPRLKYYIMQREERNTINV